MAFQYAQCHLRRGNVHQKAWIPSVFAHRGKYLKIKGEDGWRVISVGGRLPAEFVLGTLANEYRHHRNVTDI